VPSAIAEPATRALHEMASVKWAFRCLMVVIFILRLRMLLFVERFHLYRAAIIRERAIQTTAGRKTCGYNPVRELPVPA